MTMEGDSPRCCVSVKCKIRGDRPVVLSQRQFNLHDLRNYLITIILITINNNNLFFIISFKSYIHFDSTNLIQLILSMIRIINNCN